MKIDAHQHFWRYDPVAYPWIRTDVLRHTYLPADLRPQLDAAGFDGTVAVQARSTWEETAWLLDLADEHSWIAGVVGWADVANPQLPQQLEAHADRPRLCGIRCGIQSSPDGGPSGAFLTGIAVLTDADLTFDLSVRPPQLPLATRLVQATPHQRFILDHIAKPLIKDRAVAPWEADIRELAAHPNVACKVSGMVTEADRAAWQPADFAPYLDVVLDAFGADRLMIGSDWPVCRQAAEYGEAMGVVEAYLGALSADEQSAVLGGTAIEWYGLDSRLKVIELQSDQIQHS